MIFVKFTKSEVLNASIVIILINTSKISKSLSHENFHSNYCLHVFCKRLYVPKIYI